MAYILPLVCFVVPLIMAVVAMRQGIRWLIPVMLVIGVVFFAWALWRGQQSQGWDGLGYAIFGMLVAAPSVLGTLAGALIGWIRNRRTTGPSS